MTNLKPCPFCDETKLTTDVPPMRRSVYCSCGASAPNIGTWNTRANLKLEWRPIESAQKDGTEILFWEQGKKIKMGFWLPESAGWSVYGWKCSHGNFHNPTHWMPLPEPPKGGDYV